MEVASGDNGEIPAFADLPKVADSNERHAWDVWGRDDELGTINFITPDTVRMAAGCVRQGTVVSLSAGVNDTQPGLFPRRQPARHTILATSHGRDDRLDSLYPQYGSQWDGLRHIKFRSHGYWGGRTDEQLDSSDTLGIHHWADRGLVGRGVLIDVSGYCESAGRPISPEESFPISAELLDETLAAQATEVRPGDIVLVRTGWMDWYLDRSIDDRMSYHGKVGAPEDPFSCPGLESSRETAAWLWDHRVAAIAADNPAVEVMPVSREAGFLHYRLIPLLGMALGEMWVMATLAWHCRRSGHYDFLLSGGILKVRGGVGSPASACAVL